MTKILHFFVSAILCASFLPFSGCTTFGDDAFVIHAKRGHTSQALANIKPHSGQLRVTETNGKTYYPIEYTLINGDERLTYALIENGSPTRLYGKSLAYNAAYAGRTTLARDLASNGYGSSGDIASAQARKAADQRRQAANARAAMIFGLGVLAVLMSSGGSSRGGSDSCYMCGGYTNRSDGMCSSCAGGYYMSR